MQARSRVCGMRKGTHIKEFKRIAMRGDKTDQSFSAIIYVASAVINSR